MIITGFQLRAAKKTLNLTLDQLSNDTKISKVTLARLMNTINNNDEIRCSVQDGHKLFTYFYNKNLLFPNQYTIELNEPVEPRPVETNLTRFQFINARVAMHLSQKGLAKHIILGHGSFQRFEEQSNNCYIKNSKVAIRDLVLFFNENGVYFPDNKSVKIKYII